eukprot:gene10039-11110_t
MDEVQQLREQVAQRDEIISTMKQRTKDFIAKLKSDHQMEIEKQRETLSKDFEEKIVALERKVASTKEAAKQQTDQLTEMQRLLTDCQQRSAELESSLSSQLQRKEQEWREEVIQLKAQIAQREQGMATLQKDLSEKQEKVFSLDFQLVELRSLHDTAKKVVQPPSADSALESLTVENLNAELSTLQAAKEKLEDELSTLLTTISQKDDALQAAFAEVNQVKQRAAETEETLLQELANLQDEVAKLTSELTLEKAKSGYRKLRVERSELFDKVQTLEASISHLELMNGNLQMESRKWANKLEESQQNVLSLENHTARMEEEKALAKAQYEEEVLSLRSALQQSEQISENHSGEAAAEIISLRDDLQAKAQLVTNLAKEQELTSESLHLLEEEKKSWEMQRKEMQIHIEDLVSSLRSKDETLQTLQHVGDEKEKGLRNQVTTLSSQLKTRTQELSLQCDNLKAELLQTNALLENLKTQLLQAQKEKIEWKELQEKTQAKLDQETNRKQDISKHTAELLEKLNSEKDALIAAKEALEITNRDLVNRLEGAEIAAKLNDEKLHVQYQAKVQGLEALLMEKDDEIIRLKFEMTSSLHEMSEMEQKMEVNVKELEVHKTKRTATQNELLRLIKSLERAQSEAQDIKTTLQGSINPTVYRQINDIESLVRNVEQVAFLLTNPRSKAKPATVSHSTPPSASNRADIELVPTRSSQTQASSRRPSAPNSSGGLHTISEALSLLSTLRANLDRSQMGLTLLSLSVTKLMDIASPNSSDSSRQSVTGANSNESSSGLGIFFNYCSTAVYDFVSDGLAQVNHDVSGSYIAPTFSDTDDRSSLLPNSNSSGLSNSK